jgi:hypothetical protein
MLTARQSGGFGLGMNFGGGGGGDDPGNNRNNSDRHLGHYAPVKQGQLIREETKNGGNRSLKLLDMPTLSSGGSQDAMMGEGGDIRNQPDPVDQGPRLNQFRAGQYGQRPGNDLLDLFDNVQGPLHRPMDALRQTYQQPRQDAQQRQYPDRNYKSIYRKNDMEGEN